VLLSAATTGHGARGPRRPERNLTVDSARVCVAVLGLGESGTFAAAVVGRVGDGTVPGVLTAAADGATHAEVAPLTDDAVEGTAVGVASLGDIEGGASVACTKWLAGDCASAGGYTRATALVAVRPFEPVAETASGIALANVAGVEFIDVGAREATLRRGGEHDTHAHLLSSGGSAHVATTVAESPAGPVGDLAADGTQSSAACLSLLEVGKACVAAVGRGNNDTTSAGVSAGAAAGGAGGPIAPARHLAVHRAGGATVLTLDEVAASSTGDECLGLSDGTESVLLPTGAARLGAGSPCAKIGGEAILGGLLAGAAVCVAELLVNEGLAGESAVAGGDGDATSTVVLTAKAFLGAGAPSAPSSELAIDRTGVLVADDMINTVGAALAAVGRGLDDLTPLELETTSAGAAAGGRSGPRGNGAVLGALAVSTSLVVDEYGAAGAAEFGGSSDGTVAVENCTRATRLVAAVLVVPTVPLSDLAVHGAAVTVAGLELVKYRAANASAEPGAGDGPIAESETITADLRAIAPSTPGCDRAISVATLEEPAGAGDVVARVFLYEGGTGDAPIAGRLDHGANTSAETAATGDGARCVSTPARDRAINGAELHVAVDLLRHGRGTRSATVGSGGDDRASTALLTAAACLSAGGPLGPVRDFAVDNTGAGAGRKFVESRAGSATVSGCSGNVTNT
jgi:hypothetical protein